MLFVLLIIPLIMIFYGLRWRRKPPAYPRNPDVAGWTLFLGYRTEWSLKSEDTWYYAHISYGRMIFPLGIIALVINFVGVMLLPLDWGPTALLILDLLLIMLPYYPIEKKMRSVFDIYGKMKEE